MILSFTAQPEAPASTKAGASGWAVNRMPADYAEHMVSP
jgi:hypothetical protein